MVGILAALLLAQLKICGHAVELKMLSQLAHLPVEIEP
jgi:hypothetical protein